MLRHLRIRNLAVIEAVDVEFDAGFNVLSGETGAGKSILIEAVGLLLGGRASADLVRTGEATATIEALFELSEPLPDLGSEILVRRELTHQGRSRAFVNGTLATAGMLRDLASRLVELHGQHEHQALLDPATHLPLLDSFAGLGSEAAVVEQAFAEVRHLRERLERSSMNARERAARLELVAFQLAEIDKVSPKPDEDEALQASRLILASAERVQRLCEESFGTLYDSEDAVLSKLGGVWKRVSELADIDPAFSPYMETRDAIKGQLEDLALFLRDYMSRVDASPAALQQTEDRLAQIERLKRRFGPTLADVLAQREVLVQERALLADGEGAPGELEARLAVAEGAFLDAARRLSGLRQREAKSFSGKLETILAGLAMAQTRFEVRFTDVASLPDRWSARGVDEVEFYVSPNVGEAVRPLVRIVSGGELSRIMLALKTLAAGDETARTLIFDEAGIGGRVATVVGERLGELGQRFQVLCITHLPQIAVHATTHFRIEKTVRGGRTVTAVERLEPEARVDEVSRMLGGDPASTELRVSALSLINRARGLPQGGAKGENSPKTKGESERRNARGAKVSD